MALRTKRQNAMSHENFIRPAATKASLLRQESCQSLAAGRLGGSRPTTRNALGDIQNVGGNAAGGRMLKAGGMVKPEARKALRDVSSKLPARSNTISGPGDAKEIAAQKACGAIQRDTVRVTRRAGVTRAVTLDENDGTVVAAVGHNLRPRRSQEEQGKENNAESVAVEGAASHELKGEVIPAPPKQARVTRRSLQRKRDQEHLNVVYEEVSCLSGSKEKFRAGAGRGSDILYQSASEAFSAEALSAAVVPEIPNIDEEDADNPLMVSEYVQDIYGYLRDLEKEQSIRDNFLLGREVTGRMRAVVVDWLVQVEVRFRLLPETLYMTVALLDRYLQEVIVSKTKLQLLAVSAMFLASKYEEIYAPEVHDFVYISDNSCQKENILATEISILKALKFQLGRPLPIHFLRRFSKAVDADPKRHTIGKYLCELALVEYSLAHVHPSLIAAVASYISGYLLDEEPMWGPTMEHYSAYSEKELIPVVRLFGKMLLKNYSPKAKLSAVRNKFASSKFMKISTMAVFNSDLITKLATFQ